jgi:hypothetical protein
MLLLVALSIKLFAEVLETLSFAINTLPIVTPAPLINNLVTLDVPFQIVDVTVPEAHTTLACTGVPVIGKCILVTSAMPPVAET